MKGCWLPLGVITDLRHLGGWGCHFGIRDRRDVCQARACASLVAPQCGRYHHADRDAYFWRRGRD